MPSVVNSARLGIIVREVRTSHRLLVLTSVGLIALSAANPEYRPVDYALAELKALAAIRPEVFLEKVSPVLQSDLKKKFVEWEEATSPDQVLFPFHEFRSEGEKHFPVIVFWQRPVTVEESWALLHGHPGPLVVLYLSLHRDQYSELLEADIVESGWRLQGVFIECREASEFDLQRRLILGDGSVVFLGPLPNDPTGTAIRRCPEVLLGFGEPGTEVPSRRLYIRTDAFKINAAYATFGFPLDWLVSVGLAGPPREGGADAVMLPHSLPFFWEIRDLPVYEAIRYLESKSVTGIGDVNVVGLVISRAALFGIAPWFLAGTMLYALLYIIELYSRSKDSLCIEPLPWIGLIHNRLAGTITVVSYALLPALAAYFLVRRVATPWQVPQGIGNGGLLVLATAVSVLMGVLVFRVRSRFLRVSLTRGEAVYPWL